MSKFLLSALSSFLFFFPSVSFGQCNNFVEVLSEGFEYSTQTPGYITNFVYHPNPASFCPHSGAKSLYLNFQNDSIGLAYDWSIETCENATYKFSFWAKDCWSDENDITVSVDDSSGTELISLDILTDDNWSQYTLGPFTTSSSPIHFKITTNIAGGPGNDLSIDDISLQMCTPDVNINANPVEAFGDGVCTDSPLSLFLPASGINYTNPEFQWQQSLDAGLTWIDISGADSASVDLTGFVDGEQIRCIIAEAGNLNEVDCRFITDPVTLVVNPLPTINPPVDYELCGNLDSLGFAAFNLHSTISGMRTNPGDEFHFYESYEDAELDTLEAAQLDYINTTNPDTVYIRVINEYGCHIVDSMTLIALEQPRVNLGADTSLCEDQPILLDATYDNPDATYLWQDGSTESTFNVSEEGLHHVTVTLGECTAYDEIMLTLYQLPDFDFGPNIDKCKDDTVKLNSGIEGAIYTWSTGSTDEEIMVTEFGEYELTVETECGTFTDRIEVEPIFCGCPIYFPNSISPNGDGVNDYFQLLPECEFEVYDLIIYDRWGKEVFASIDPNEIWEGPEEADPHQTMYVYYLTYTFQYSPVFEKNGVITIFQ